MAIYVRDYPHDGQDSLGAAMDAMMWFVVIEIVSWVLLYRLRRRYSAGSLNHPHRNE